MGVGWVDPLCPSNFQSLGGCHIAPVMLNESKTSRPRPKSRDRGRGQSYEAEANSWRLRPRPRQKIMKKYQIIINNMPFKIIGGKINKIPEFYTTFARKVLDNIIRRDRGQAEAKCLRPRPTFWPRGHFGLEDLTSLHSSSCSQLQYVYDILKLTKNVTSGLHPHPHPLLLASDEELARGRELAQWPLAVATWVKMGCVTLDTDKY